MGLFDVVGSLLGGQNAGGQQQNVLAAVTEFVNNQPGGLQGLIQQFESQGAGGLIRSWIGTGANQAVSPGTLQSVVGSGALSELAGKLGVSPEQASGLLAQILPHVVDHATPGGEVPQTGQIDTGNVLESIGKAGGLGSLVEGWLGKQEG
ncbi:YidB family protein [Trinickia diaoshuihuensis]|uniref:YidB family protein n=1 Tax=Trinickia diaoshuihuensis TaxID=2292265 RepID=UPI000E229789|nr:YidB family protein [Trinickia diaoshuihuensis]